MTEVVFATALFTAFAVVSILSFTAFNRLASNSRYETLALAIAQEKIDQVLTSPCAMNSDGSYGPVLSLSGTTISPKLTGTGSVISGTETSLPLNYDGYNLSRTITYGGTPGVALTGTLSGTNVAGADGTMVIDSRVTKYSAVSGNPRLLNVTVTVNYTYRGLSYLPNSQFSVSMTTQRTTDDF